MDVMTMWVAAGVAVALVFLMVKALSLEVGVVFRAALNALMGIGALFLVNATTAFTGWTLSIDPVNVIVVSIFGVPGLGLISLLGWMLT